MPEWKNYACIIPKNKGHISNSECSLLSTIYHIVHLPMAWRILEDGCLQAGGLLDPPAHYSGYVMSQKLHFP